MMTEETPNYADIVKRNVTLGGSSSQAEATKGEVEKVDDEKDDPTLAHTPIVNEDSRGLPTKQSIDAVKPYIPSYLAALKARKPTVTLKGVPLKVNPKPDTLFSPTNVSNSILEHESTSSWADDDDDFLLSIARFQQQKGVEMRTVASHGGAGDVVRRGNNMGRFQDNLPRQAGKQSVEGGESGAYNTYHEQKGRGCRKVEKGASSSGNVGKPRGRQQGGRQGSNATQSNSGGTASNPAFLSGGRFDVLANVKIMKRI